MAICTDAAFLCRRSEVIGNRPGNLDPLAAIDKPLHDGRVHGLRDLALEPLVTHLV